MSARHLRDVSRLTGPELAVETFRLARLRDEATTPAVSGYASSRLAVIGREVLHRETLDAADVVERPEFTLDGDLEPVTSELQLRAA